MKNILFLALFLLAQQPVRAQSKWMPINKKAAPKPPPPVPPPPPPPVIRDVTPSKSKVEMIFENAGPPLTFLWKIDADTLLPAEVPYQKTLELDVYSATMRTRFQKEAFELKKETPTLEGTVNATSHYSETIGFNTELRNTTAMLTNRETGKKSSLSFF